MEKLDCQRCGPPGGIDQEFAGGWCEEIGKVEIRLHNDVAELVISLRLEAQHTLREGSIVLEGSLKGLQIDARNWMVDSTALAWFLEYHALRGMFLEEPPEPLTRGIVEPSRVERAQPFAADEVEQIVVDDGPGLGEAQG